MLYEEVFDYLKEQNVYFDMVSLDCTMVENPVSDEGSHMGIDGVVRVKARLMEAGTRTGGQSSSPTTSPTTATQRRNGWKSCFCRTASCPHTTGWKLNSENTYAIFLYRQSC